MSKLLTPFEVGYGWADGGPNKDDVNKSYENLAWPIGELTTLVTVQGRKQLARAVGYTLSQGGFFIEESGSLDDPDQPEADQEAA